MTAISAKAPRKMAPVLCFGDFLTVVGNGCLNKDTCLVPQQNPPCSASHTTACSDHFGVGYESGEPVSSAF